MARDLKDDSAWMDDINRKLSRIFSGAFLENSSISNGRMRFIGGLLLIDSGGTLQVVGQLVGDGEFRWVGPWMLEGPGQITGNVDVTGTIKVLAGGKIQVGNIVIDPTISGGAITFENGAQVFTDATTIQVYKGNGVVQISDTEAKLLVGGTEIRLQPGHIYASGMAARSVDLHPGAFVGAVVNVGNELYRLI